MPKNRLLNKKEANKKRKTNKKEKKDGIDNVL